MSVKSHRVRGHKNGIGNRSARLLAIAASAALGLVGWHNASAATYTWTDGNGDLAWNTASNSDWDNGGATPWVDGNDAVFAGTGVGTIAVSAVSPNSLTFNSAGYTLSGGTITLSTGSLTDNVFGAESATINSAIAGGNTAGLISATSYSGTLTLGGTDNLNGMQVNGGTFEIASTGTVNLNGVGSQNAFYVGNGDGDGGGGGANGTLILDSGSQLNVSSINYDTFVIGRDGGTGAVTQNGGTFTFNPGGNHNFLVSANGTGTYTLNGGTLNLNGQFLGVGNYGGTGIFNLNGGKLQALNIGAISGSGSSYFAFNGGTLQVTGSGGNMSGIPNVYVRNGGAIIDTNSNTFTIYQSLLHSTINGDNATDGGLTLSDSQGTGTLILSGQNTYTGQTTVNAGTLVFNTGNVIPVGNSIVVNNGGNLQIAVNDIWGNWAATSSPILTVNSGGILSSSNAFATLWNVTLNSGTIQTNGGANPVAQAFQFCGTLTATGSSLTVVGGGGNGLNNINIGGQGNNILTISTPNVGDTFTVNNTLQNGMNVPSGLTKTGLGTLILNASNTYTGGTIVSAGTLQLGNQQGVPDNTPITITGGTLDLGGFTKTTSATVSFQGGVTQNGTIVNNGAPYDGQAGTVSASLRGTAGLTKTNGGNLILSGTDSLGGFQVNGGNLDITGTINTTGGNDYVANGDAIVGAVGTLTLETGSYFTISSIGSDTFVIGRDNNAQGTVTQNGGIFTYSAGSDFLVSAGASTGIYNMNGGTLALNGAFLGVGNYGGTGIFNLNGGILQALYIGERNGGTAGSYFAFNGGTLQITGSGGNMSGIPNAYVRNGGAIIDTNSNTFTLSQSLLHSTINGDNATDGGLTLSDSQGTGTLILSGQNTYTGQTTVNAGTLVFNTGNVIPVGNSIVVNNGGNLQIAVNDIWGNWAATSSPILTVNSGGILSSSNAFATLWNVTLNSGTIQTNGGANPVAQAFQFCGTLTATGSSLTVVGGGGNGLNNINIGGQGNNILTISTPNVGDTFTVNNTLQNGMNVPSGLTKTGLGTLILNASNTYTGGTIVSAGTLQLGNQQGVPDNTPITITGGTLDLGGFTKTTSATVSFQGGVTQNGTIVNNGAPYDGQAGTVSASLQGSAGLVKTTGGNMIVSGTDSVVGLQVNGGTLHIAGTFDTTGGLDYVANGGSTTGTLVLDNGGSLNVTGNYGDSFVIGRDSGSGIVTQNAGSSFDFNPSNVSYLFITASNNASSNSTYNMNGGSLNMNGNNLDVGFGAGAVAQGTLNITGGSISDVGHLYVGESIGIGVVTQSGGAITVNNPIVLGSNAIFGGSSSGQGTYNLNGGTVTTPGVTLVTGTATFNFNGGTLQAYGSGQSYGSFMNGLTTANVRNGGAIIDTNGNTVTIGQSLVHSTIGGDNATDGGLTLSDSQGTGTLILSGQNTYTGQTTVNAGTLVFDTGNVIPVGNSVVVNGGNLQIAVNDIWGVWNATASPVITVNSGGILSSSNAFATLWNVNLNSGTIQTNGGANPVAQAFQFCGTLTATGSSLTLVGGGGNGLNNINIGGQGNNTLTIYTPNAGDTLTVNNTLQNGMNVPSGLTKTGLGTLTLTQANIYTGATAVNGGTLSITGSLANSTVAVNNSGTLAGTGSISSTITVASGGTITAGTASTSGVGTLTTGSQTWMANGTYLWKTTAGLPGTSSTFGSSVSAATSNNNQDLLEITGGGVLNIQTPFNLEIVQAGGIDNAMQPGNAFIIANVAGGQNNIQLNGVTITGAGDLANAFSVYDGSSGNGNDGYGYTVSLVADVGGSADIEVTVTPEPGSLGLLGMASLGLLRRRRTAPRAN